MYYPLFGSLCACSDRGRSVRSRKYPVWKHVDTMAPSVGKNKTTDFIRRPVLSRQSPFLEGEKCGTLTGDLQVERGANRVHESVELVEGCNLFFLGCKE